MKSYGRGKYLCYICNLNTNLSSFLQLTTTQKHINFVGNPIPAYQVVETVPGIGLVYGGNLRANNITTARQLLGYFLIMNGNREEFLKWLSNFCIPRGPRAEHHMSWCYTALMDWTNQHI